MGTARSTYVPLSFDETRGDRLIRASPRAVVMLGLALLLLIPQLAAPQSGDVGEYDVKAAFLYNFAMYVEWPSETPAGETGDFVIGVLGDDPFGPSLDAMARERSVGGRRVVVKRFASMEQYVPCHILFVSRGNGLPLSEILSKADRAHVLVVGETKGFASDGGMVNFYIEDSKVRFEINPDAAELAGLSISSKLLRLASIVRDGVGGA